MTLPAFAEGDESGLSTYPALLVAFNAANKLHISEEYPRSGTLCAASLHLSLEIVEYIGKGKRRPVCSKCRQEWQRRQ